jgi:polyhydroxybutyrate depolymerase
MKKALKIFLIVIALLSTALALLAGGLARELREPALSGELHREQLAVGALTRTFSFYAPARTEAQPALIFVLHGSDGSGELMRRMSLFRFDTLADAKGAIVVYPDGYKKFWNDCRASADYAANIEKIDDSAFFAAMIDHFVQTRHVDPQRVYATGISNGGHMIYRLGLEIPQRFAALAAMAANLPVDTNLDCTASGQPVSMAILNGTQDPINPYAGGLVSIMGNSSRGHVRSSADTVQYWAGLAGAHRVGTTRLPEADDNSATWIDREIYRGDSPTEIRLYTLHGSGHVMPVHAGFVMTRLLGVLLGGNAGDMDSATELWEFFDAHRRPEPN